MAFTYLRHQLHLHRHKIVALLVVASAGLGQQVNGQGKVKGENLPGYEFKKLRWGFSLGVNSSWYQLEHSQTYVNTIRSDTSSTFSVNEKPGIGFNVNFITTYRLTPDFLVRAQPGVGYHSRSVLYKGVVDGEGIAPRDVLQENNTFSAELPVLVKYESNRRKNTQMYFVAGVKPSLVIGGQKKGNPEVLQLSTFDFALEYGVGLDMFYPYFKFAPEIRYSRGFTNLHEPYNTVYNNNIQRLSTNTITLYLNFE